VDRFCSSVFNPYFIRGEKRMKVNVKLFAVAKQRAGVGQVAVELPDAATVADLKRALAASFPALAPLVPNLMIAVDAEYADDDRGNHAGSPKSPPSPRSAAAGRSFLPTWR